MALEKGLAGEEEAVTEAINLYRGDLLEGFALRDSIEFEEWIEPQAELLRRSLLRALEQLTRRQAADGRFEAAAATASSWLLRDPLNEAAYRWLMQFAAWRGDRSDALSRYRECVRLLDAELGVTPLPETTELYLSIRAGTSPPLHRSASNLSSRLAQVPPTNRSITRHLSAVSRSCNSSSRPLAWTTTKAR
jgi:DNA-binding SARP family transcriptional activator